MNCFLSKNLKLSSRVCALGRLQNVRDSFKRLTQQKKAFSCQLNCVFAIAVDKEKLKLPKRFKCSNTGANRKVLTLENINPNFVAMEYAVRGPLVIRAAEIEKEMEQGAEKPFTEVVRLNIGDAQALGQKPLTYVRQLLALCFDPSLLDSDLYPEDVKQRACDILNACKGHSIGAYTDSVGIELIRKQVAEFIERRDCIPSDWRHIYLTSGATAGIKSILSLMCAEVDGKPPGIMIPIPQYPLYSATIAEYGMQKIGYYLNEDANWGLSCEELQRSFDEARCSLNPRALVVINPGNPTGQVLTRPNIEEIIKFASDKRLVILADEVYQPNIHDANSQFHAFKKVMHEMGEPYKEMELISFMSTSKGYLGECGIRGGYMEIVNMCPKVLAMLTKSLTASLCATTAGQAALSALVNPPQLGEPSYQNFVAERDAIGDSLRERAELLYTTLNSLEGLKVNVIQGALYVFPQIDIPPKAIEAAKAKNMTPDTFYAFELLEATGICFVPGSGFDQQPCTHHFRSTILPQMDKLKMVMEKFKDFHAEFLNKYKGEVEKKGE